MNGVIGAAGFDPGIDPVVVEALVHGRYGDPFAVLGPHETPGGWTIRAFVPDASAVAVLDRVQKLPLGGLQRGTGFFVMSLVPESAEVEKAVYLYGGGSPTTTTVERCGAGW